MAKRGERSETFREDAHKIKRLRDLRKRGIRSLYLFAITQLFLSFLSFLPIFILIPTTLNEDVLIKILLFCCRLNVSVSARLRIFWIRNWALLWIISLASSFSSFAYSFGIFIIAIIVLEQKLCLLCGGLS